jgi:hypothetical protein
MSSLRTNEFRDILRKANEAYLKRPNSQANAPVSQYILAELWALAEETCSKNGVSVEALDIDEELDNLGMLAWINRKTGAYRYPTSSEIRNGTV